MSVESNIASLKIQSTVTLLIWSDESKKRKVVWAFLFEVRSLIEECVSRFGGLFGENK